MRINVNLASRKYEDVRQFYLRWGAAVGLLVVITVGLALLAWFNFQNSASDRKRINELHGKLERLDEERRQAEAIRNKPENRDVRDESSFWNDIIDQRSFSWTQLFTDLEKIMPARARLVSVQPTLTPEKSLELHLQIEGATYDNAVELVSKMEHSERFHSPKIDREDVRSVSVPGMQGPAAQKIVHIVDIKTFYTPASHLPHPQATAKEGL